MNVLLTTHELAFNGACVGLIRLAEHLVQRGHPTDILVPPGKVRAFADHCAALGVRLLETVLPSDYDVVVVNTLYGQNEVKSFAGIVPVLWWIKEGPHGTEVTITKTAVRDAFSLASKVAFNAAFLVEDVYRSFIYRLPSSRIEVVGNGIPPRPEVKPVAKPVGRKRVVCVASVYPRKRQADLITALQALNAPDVECVMIGEAHSLSAASAALVRDYPQRFILTGALPPEKVHAYYASADIFCLPSGDESFGRAPLEAGQHGVPAVICDLPAYEGIWRHGRNALLYPTGDQTMLKWSLQLLLDEPELGRRLGLAAQQTAAQWQDNRMLALLETALVELANSPMARKRRPKSS